MWFFYVHRMGRPILTLIRLSPRAKTCTVPKEFFRIYILIKDAADAIYVIGKNL
jgi:hypothetical protein